MTDCFSENWQNEAVYKIKTYLSYNALKTMMNLTKYVQNLYNEDYTTLLREIRELNKEIYHVRVCGLEGNIVKMSTLPSLTWRFNTTSIKKTYNAVKKNEQKI